MYRAFYKPSNGVYEEDFEDAETLEGLSPNAILIIQLNDDGTRSIVDEKVTLTPKEQTFFDYAQRHLEFKYDGGPTPDAPSKGDVA
jgi:hypothetical protein